ncbi:MAG: hypothetical protein QOJ03_3470 [Frankiaceae bacterium]|nr:hypothetical protein [Frankiaceae bacterium]
MEARRVTRFPLALRLAALAALVVTGLLTVVGMFLYSRLAHELETALDLQLRQEVQDLSGFVTRTGPSLASTKPIGSIEYGETFAEVLAADGTVLDATPSLQRVALLEPAQVRHVLRRHELFTELPAVPGLDEPVRMLSIRLLGSDGPIVLVAGATAQNRAEALASVRNKFWTGGPPTVVLLTVGAYLLARAALRPVEAMRARAATISATTSGQRLPLLGGRDEISRLGSTLNDMLGRLERGLEREREFVARASHELRTPLALLKTELELAVRRPRSGSDLEIAIASAIEETDRLTRLADDLLFIARDEQDAFAVQPQTVDLAELARRVSQRFMPRARQLGREVTASNGHCEAHVDPLRVEQALSNLVDNALTHGGGVVTVSVARSGAGVVLTVTDEGPGFDAELLPHAFERFTRVPRAGHVGAGLGLSVVDAVAAAHGGRATAKNAPTGGAAVALTLPDGERPAPQKKPTI